MSRETLRPSRRGTGCGDLVARIFLKCICFWDPPSAKYRTDILL